MRAGEAPSFFRIPASSEARNSARRRESTQRRRDLFPEAEIAVAHREKWRGSVYPVENVLAAIIGVIPRRRDAFRAVMDVRAATRNQHGSSAVASLIRVASRPYTNPEHCFTNKGTHDTRHQLVRSRFGLLLGDGYIPSLQFGCRTGRPGYGRFPSCCSCEKLTPQRDSCIYCDDGCSDCYRTSERRRT